MDPTAKPWWESATVWGVVITALSGLLGRYGVDLAPADQKALAGAIIAIASPLGILIGVIRTIWGRARAKAPLTGQIMPRAGGATLSALIAVIGLGSVLGGCASLDQGQIIRIGQAAYAVECKTALPGAIGAAAVSVASIRAPDSSAARTLRSAVDVHDAMIAALCPAARTVEIVVGQR